MIETFLTGMAIYGIGVFIYFGIKGLFESLGNNGSYSDTSCWPDRKTKNSNVCEKLEEKFKSDEEFYRLRKRYLESVKDSYYERGEGAKWEEMMMETDEALGRFY